MRARNHRTAWGKKWVVKNAASALENTNKKSGMRNMPSSVGGRRNMKRAINSGSTKDIGIDGTIVCFNLVLPSRLIVTISAGNDLANKEEIDGYPTPTKKFNTTRNITIY